MNNPRISAKERGLIKGAIRRVFSRSELRSSVIEASVLPNYTDDTRTRVKTWCRCKLCQTPTPKSYMECDHILPIIPLNNSLDNMTWDDIVDNIWCAVTNLQAVCPDCHSVKTKEENKKRRERKKNEKIRDKSRKKS